MSGHGGFPISTRVAIRASQERASTVPIGGVGLHGTSNLAGILGTSVITGVNHENLDGSKRDPADQDMKGFRHFLSDGAPARRLLIGGQHPLMNDATVAGLRSLMSRLAKRMERHYTWDEHTDEVKESYPGPLQPGENPRIPSGYTYL